MSRLTRHGPAVNPISLVGSGNVRLNSPTKPKPNPKPKAGPATDAAVDCCICFHPLRPPPPRSRLGRLVFGICRLMGCYGNRYRLWRCGRCRVEVHHACMRRWREVHAREVRTTPRDRLGCPVCRATVLRHTLNP